MSMGEIVAQRPVGERIAPKGRVVVEPSLIAIDEPRRSSRANKGSNSDRWQEVLDSARHNFVDSESIAGDTATDAGTIVTDAVAHEETQGEDRIRCVCGQTEEVEDEDKDFVQCDQCQVWQHNQCVGLPSEVPENEDYFCERCRPDLHVKLLNQLKRNKPVKRNTKLKVASKRKRVEDEPDSDNASNQETKWDAAQTGKVGRSRSSSVSDISVVSNDSEKSTVLKRASNKKVNSPQDASIRPEVGPRSPAAVTKVAKRKATNTQAKKSKIASVHHGAYQDVNEIDDPERKKIGTALIRLIGDAFKIAIENEGYLLSGETSVETEARKLGLQIEFAMFDARLDVRAKFRQLSFNLKDPKNPSLRKRVLDRSLQLNELINMSSEDMANPELKAKTEALREESLKQSVLVQETGPRIRRTHKGEEYVEALDASSLDIVAVQPGISRERVRDMSSSPASIHSPEPSDVDDDENDSETEQKAPAVPRRERSNSNFDIKDVWSHIEPPKVSDSPQSESLTRRLSSEPMPFHGDDNDEDILGMLETGRASGKNSYNYASGEVVWDGQVLMPSISDLQAKATLLGGPRQVEVDWLTTFTSLIQIDGRIPRPDATKYLCHQKFSQSKSVYVLRIDAVEGKEPALKTLYNYFMKKDRYGVIKPGKTRLRDGYVVPLPADAALPDFITMLPSFNLPAERSDLLLAVLVLEKLDIKFASPATEPAEAKRAETISPASRLDPLPIVNSPQIRDPAIHRPTTTFQAQSLQSTAQTHPPSSARGLPPAVGMPANAMSPHQQYQRQPMMPEMDPYTRRAQMGRMEGPAQMNFPPGAQPPPQPVQLDSNAQAVLGAFLRAHPAIANNPQVIASPQLMGKLLEEFVNNGGMQR